MGWHDALRIQLSRANRKQVGELLSGRVQSVRTVIQAGDQRHNMGLQCWLGTDGYHSGGEISRPFVKAIIVGRINSRASTKRAKEYMQIFPTNWAGIFDA